MGGFKLLIRTNRCRPVGLHQAAFHTVLVLVLWTGLLCSSKLRKVSSSVWWPQDRQVEQFAAECEAVGGWALS